tara:strand:- start:4039 stop:4299 length:261 start_codon:yes stop_codon:yes gene_type:complete
MGETTFISNHPITDQLKFTLLVIFRLLSAYEVMKQTLATIKASVIIANIFNCLLKINSHSEASLIMDLIPVTSILFLSILKYQLII